MTSDVWHMYAHKCTTSIEGHQLQRSFTLLSFDSAHLFNTLKTGVDHKVFSLTELGDVQQHRKQQPKNRAKNKQ